MIVEKDVETSIYEIPLVLSRAGLDEIILNRFRIAQTGQSVEGLGKSGQRDSQSERKGPDWCGWEIFRTAGCV